MKNKAELVLVPTPAMGHLVSIVELAKHLLDRHEHFSITVLLIKPFFFPSYNLYVESLAASENRLRYIHLPPPPPPSEPVVPKSPEKFFSDFLESHKSQVREAIVNHVLSSSPATARLAGVVVDFLCTAMIDVANEFAAPTYLFFPSSAAFLGLMLHLPIRHALIGTEFSASDPNSVTHFPSYANPVPTSVLPAFLFNKHGGYNCLLNHARRFREAKGIIVNTFEELESYAVKSLLASPESPPVYAVGPLLDLAGNARSGSDRDKILKWLDEQPMSSVVFLCFGSLGCFDPPQLAEIAAALEKSGHRFLWSIRRPPPEGGLAMPADCGGDHEGLLPEGFLKRTENRGMVCGWAPQTAVLCHAAVGGFVSHCGWNSILESLWFGVPIVTWPIYAEQQINAFEMVVDLDLAVELRLDCRDERSGASYGSGGVEVVVAAEEIERAMKGVMDSGNLVRERVREMREKSREAFMEGGSSFSSLKRLVDGMVGND
ncbi:anthocyanidin 3-O-glucosyltransferase 2-like [Camellia sinensis]|uniref:Glycosyltransferase n=1 Tax=Camellia sinensis var. sinensis TaxID=542762 RepID=A0A4S4DHP7_CAMSN|nr:anthocyanidin 3-O-glucosyltransferase 2-like [Camellia sinensis]THG02330.1 hypothetical protein TEA_021172 [Camellia sinensis var. sinensis]